MDKLAPSPQKFDSTYIENYSKDLLLRFYGVSKYTGFRFNTDIGNIVFSSAPQLNIGVGFNYRWLGLNFGFNFRFINPNLDKYGKQKRFDWQFQIYQRKYIIDGILQYYKGFYVKKTTFDLPSTNDDYPPTAPNLKMNNIGINFLYNFNSERFSYQAAFINNEIQKKSAGTPLIGMNFLWQYFRTDTAILATKYPMIYNDSLNLSRIYFVNMGILGGYAYTFVFAKHFYLSLSLTPGINFEISDISSNPNAEKHYSALLKFTARAAFGYNYKNFFFSVMGFTDGNYGSFTYGKIYYRSGNARFNIGMRLDVHAKSKTKPNRTMNTKQ